MSNKKSQKWTILLLTIAVFMAGLDNGIISAALTTIYNSFNVSPTWGAWSVTIYTLGVAIAVPIIGKLSDNYGRKKVFIIEILLFGVGSLLVALSPNFTFLLIARFIQAIGGGGLFIIATSHVLATLPKKQQGKILGMIGGMHGLSAVVGPNIGAVILHITGAWQWLFLINIPIAIFIFIAAIFYMQETKQPTTHVLDLKGAILLTLAIIAMMYGITNINSNQLASSILQVTVFPYILAGILLIIYFFQHEKKLEHAGGDPIIAYSIINNRKFQLTLLLGFLAGGFLATIVFIPSYVQQVLQVPAESAGFWLTPLALAAGVGSGLGGFLTDKIGSVRTIMIAGVIGWTGFFMFYTVVQNFPTFLIASSLAGIGLGFLIGAPLNVLAGESTKKSQYGTSIGTLSLSRQIGMTIFPTIFGSFITTGVIKIEPAFQAVFGDKIISFDGVEDGEGYGQIIAEIEKVEDPYLQNQLLEITANVMNSGFQQMFILAMGISIIVLFITIFIQVKQKRIS